MNATKKTAPTVLTTEELKMVSGGGRGKHGGGRGKKGRGGGLAGKLG